jgi:hypothetical protein
MFAHLQALHLLSKKYGSTLGLEDVFVHSEEVGGELLVLIKDRHPSSIGKKLI